MFQLAILDRFGRIFKFPSITIDVLSRPPCLRSDAHFASASVLPLFCFLVQCILRCKGLPHFQRHFIVQFALVLISPLSILSLWFFDIGKPWVDRCFVHIRPDPFHYPRHPPCLVISSRASLTSIRFSLLFVVDSRLWSFVLLSPGRLFLFSVSKKSSNWRASQWPAKVCPFLPVKHIIVREIIRSGSR